MTPTIEFFTQDWVARKHHPVRLAKECLPPQWKNMPSKTEFSDTAKMCPGISDYLNSGYIISTWTDISIDQSSEYGPNASLYNNREGAASHPPHQCLELFAHRSHHLGTVKLPGCWMIKTSPGYSVMLLPLWYWPNQPWEAMPGIIHSDNHHGEVNINMILKSTEPQISIPAGTPIAQIVPFRREPVSATSRAVRVEDIKRHHIIVKMYEWYKNGITKFYRQKLDYTLENTDLDFEDSLKFPIDNFK